MKTKDVIISIFLTIVLAILVFFVAGKQQSYASPVNVFEVYLNGKSIGLLDSKNDLLSLVDKKQQEIKNKYGVDKVYPPTDLKIEEVATYNQSIKSAQDIYNLIEHLDPFTIKGYTVTIKYKDENKKPVTIHLLKKEDFKEAFYDTMSAFISTDKLDAYKNNTQLEITDTGTKIESIYWDEDITIKEDYLSTEDYIFTNANDLSKYLLFGTLDKQKEYIVKDGDSVSSIAFNNQLNVEEFLVANPNIPNKNVLLTPNQVVSIGLISPLVTIVNENEVIEDLTNKYTTEYQDDATLAYGTKKVIQTGVDGLYRATEQIQYKNGAINQVVITKKTEVKPTVNEIIVRGTKVYEGSYTYINLGSADWYWPTVQPSIITSYFEYRWGTFHKGIDISGSGFGSPIHSATDGVVIDTNSGCSNVSSGYGDTCGAGYGNFVTVSVLDGKYTVIYMHLLKNITVKVGDTVTRGQVIGSMGSSGSSTGTHLHFQINDANGTPLNPCKVAFSC